MSRRQRQGFRIAQEDETKMCFRVVLRHPAIEMLSLASSCEPQQIRNDGLACMRDPDEMLGIKDQALSFPWCLRSPITIANVKPPKFTPIMLAKRHIRRSAGPFPTIIHRVPQNRRLTPRSSTCGESWKPISEQSLPNGFNLCVAARKWCAGLSFSSKIQLEAALYP